MSKKILVIDDDLRIQRLLSMLIKSCSGIPTIINDEEKLKKELNDQREIALILLDLTMPNLSAPSVLNTIIESGRNIPVSIITGVTLSEEEREDILSKAESIIQKDDFNLENLKAMFIKKLK